MNGQEKHTALIRTVILWRKRKKKQQCYTISLTPLVNSVL